MLLARFDNRDFLSIGLLAGVLLLAGCADSDTDAPLDSTSDVSSESGELGDEATTEDGQDTEGDNTQAEQVGDSLDDQVLELALDRHRHPRLE